MCFEAICKVTFVGLDVGALAGEKHTTRAWFVLLTDFEHHLSKRHVQVTFIRPARLPLLVFFTNKPTRWAQRCRSDGSR